MSCMNNNINLLTSPYFKQISHEFDESFNSQTVINSTRNTKSIRCPICGGSVHIHDNTTVTLKDFPELPETNAYLYVNVHRYKCQNCKHLFTEDIDFKYPGTRITKRAAAWIKGLLLGRISIKAVSHLTNISWNTIFKIHKEMMGSELYIRERELKASSYKPRYLAVDEFAIHKGHTYATCVMDLTEGDIIWVGKGRAKKDFEVFFNEVDSNYLSEVEAVAMDMNASYNQLVAEHLTQATVVYDRYHMQAQYGKDVLGAVRLEEARFHKEEAARINELISSGLNYADVRALKEVSKSESKLYRELKKSRWPLLKARQSYHQRKVNDWKKY